MSDIPAPGTWVRLTRAGQPAGKWHYVTGWHQHIDRLQLACVARDRNISWALHGLGQWAVARSASRPGIEACRTCQLRQEPASLTRPRPMASVSSGNHVSRSSSRLGASLRRGLADGHIGAPPRIP